MARPSNSIWFWFVRVRERSGLRARLSSVAVYDWGDAACRLGKATVDDVMRAVEQGYPNAAGLNDRLFYAHLYVALFDDVAGNTEAARGHLTRAVENFPVAHYMWDVARVHLGKLDREPETR